MKKFFTDIARSVLIALIVAAILAVPIKAGAIWLANKLSGAPELPIGTIIAWNGKGQKPTDNWAVCDGSDGRPDLQGLFLMGVGNPGNADRPDRKKIMTTRIETHGSGEFALNAVEGDGKLPPYQVNIPPNYSVVYLIRVK